MNIGRQALGLLVAASTLLTACSLISRPVTGSYVADQRPTSLEYLSLVQTGQNLNGSLVAVRSDGAGSTKADTFSVQGFIDGDTLTLRAAVFFGLVNVTFSGRRTNDGIVLSAPTEAGSISEWTFKRSSQEDFNALITSWRGDLSASQRQQAIISSTATALAESEREMTRTILDLSSKLGEKIDGLDGSREQMNDLTHQISEDLTVSRVVIEDMQNILQEERRHAGTRPLTCYLVQSTITYDYVSKLGYAFNSRLSYRRAATTEKIRSLETITTGADDRVRDVQGTAIALKSAKQSSPFPWPQIKVAPGDEQLPVSSFALAVDEARKRLAALKVDDQAMLDAANNIMAQGKTILEEAKKQVRC